MKFEEATEKLGKADRKKLLERNTYLERINADTIGVRLHDTFVVKIHRNGTFTLNTGGWQTKTTRMRINQYSSAYINQQDFEWYISNGKGGTMPFESGMTVDATGKVV